MGRRKVLFLGLIATIACNGPSPTAPTENTVSKKVSTISITPNKSRLGMGATIELTATVKNALGGVLDSPVKWSSRRKSIAVVGKRGEVRGIGPGVDTITASSENVNASAIITVTGPIKHSYVLYGKEVALTTVGAAAAHTRSRSLTIHTRAPGDTAVGGTKDSLYTLEQYNQDSLVYVVGDSAMCDPNANVCAPQSWTLTLHAQVVDFGNDSLGVAGDTVNWATLSDAYSQDPNNGSNGLGLSSPTSITDSNGIATVKFTYSGPFATNIAGGNGGYFYVQASLKDTTGASHIASKFYLIAYGKPGYDGFWDGVPVQVGVPYDLNRHIGIYIIEGADTRVDTLAIASFYGQDPSCAVQGTVLTCSNTSPGMSLFITPSFANAPADCQNCIPGNQYLPPPIPIVSGGLQMASNKIRKR